MSFDRIRVVGAREHNLAGIDVEIPKHRLTVVTGVSGSGKSSLVFDTLAAEAQRQLYETLPAFVRGFLPSYGRPEVDLIERLAAVIVVDQRRLGGRISAILRALVDVGLDYLRLGQPLTSLSGGECQRIKLAAQLHRPGAVYVLDEPTTGLHPSDVGRLLDVLDRLVDDHHATVLVIEHDLDVIAHADHVLDLGPEGGSAGGELLFAGTPAALLDAPGSHTGEHLRRAVRRAVRRPAVIR